MLLCTVRDCRLELARDGKQLLCSRGHSFDIARSGYINLLQPQDRRSRRPGDSYAATTGRRRLHERGVTEPFLLAMAEMTGMTERDCVLDAGCGDGFYLGRLAEQTGCEGNGIDISIPAVEAAARRYAGCEWIVANADRFLPYGDGTFSKILSITGRMNPSEFRRVLREDGQLLVAVPGPDDLVELRGAGRDRTGTAVETFQPEFELTRHRRVSTHAELDSGAVQDILHAIYRPGRAEAATGKRVTFSLDFLDFQVARS